MSYESSNKVYWNAKRTSASEQAILAALAFCQNHETGQCNPSIQTLSEMTHFGLTAIKSARSQLKKLGYISWATQDDGSRCSTCEYVLKLPSQPDRSPDALPPVATRPTPRSADDSPLGRQATPKDNTKDNNNQKTKNELARLVGDEFVEAGRPKGSPKVSGVPTPDDEAAFERFWTAYPNKCPYKTVYSKKNCLKLYAMLRHDAQDARAFDAEVLNSLENKWKVNDLWTDGDPKHIKAPVNFLANRYWEIEPEPSKSRDPVHDFLMKAMEMSRAQEMQPSKVWLLCEERCARYADGACSAGIAIAPEMDDPPYPPEQCWHFQALKT